MKSLRFAVFSLGTLLGGLQFAQADVVMARDFYFHPVLYLQAQDDTKNDKDIDTHDSKTGTITNPKDKDEIAKKQMVVLGPEGGYVLGFQVYFDNFNNPAPFESNSVRFESHSEGGILGGNIMLPGKDPQGVLNSPWAKLTELTSRTSVRQTFNLRPGLNLITLTIDADHKFTEFADNGTTANWKRSSKEDNNTAVFAVNLVTKLEKPDVKLPRQNLPRPR